MMADAGVMSPTEFAKRMLNKNQRKESLKAIKENIKGSLTEIRHDVKDSVKVFKHPFNAPDLNISCRFKLNELMSNLNNYIIAFTRWSSWSIRSRC